MITSNNLRGFLAITCITLVLFSCKSNDPAPNPTLTLLTFKQDISTPTTATDDWIFVTDESGNLLDIKQFEADQSISLTSNKLVASDKMNVTIFQYRKTTTELLAFNSYLGITLNQSWIYKKVETPPTFPPQAGTFTLKVSNYPSGLQFFSVTTNEVILVGGNSNLIGSNYSSQYSLLSASPTKITITSYRNKIPVYTNFTASVGNTYTLDFLTDFKTMEHLLTPDMTGATFYTVDINGFDGPASPIAQGHLIANFSSSSNPTPPGNPVTGWPDGFANYKTNIQAVFSNTFKKYYKIGAGATAIPFATNITATIANRDYKAFGLIVSGDAQMRTSIWSNLSADPAINWTVDAPPTGIQKFSDIPTELKTRYPVLGTSTLTYSQTGFTKYFDGSTYDDYIRSTMNQSTATKPYPTEYLMIGFF